MSISTTATKVSYAGNNSNSTPYAITFKYLDVSHVTVYADKVDITTNCTFSGDGAAGTGQFTTDAAQAPTVTVTAVLDVPFDQPVVLHETGSLPAKTLEVSGFDRLNMQIRRVWRGVQDTLRFSSDEGSGSTGTADTLVGFDGSGDIEEVAKSTFVATADGINGNGDVTITQPIQTGDTLQWNGSAWVNDSEGGGDMLSSVYDPTSVAGDAFAMDNMVEGTNTKILTSTERTNIGSAMQPATYDPTAVGGDAFDSGNHVYTPAGTGAVITTVESKLRQTISPKDFGAVGNGVANDTVAVQNAISYASSLTDSLGATDVGRSNICVDLGGGLYGISDTLQVYKNIHISNGSFVALSTPTTTNFMFKINSTAERFTMSDVDFDGGLNGTTRYADLIECNAPRVTLQNIMGIHFPNYGIRFIEGSGSRIINVLMREWQFDEAGTTDDTLRTAKAFSVEDADMQFTNCIAAQSLYPFYVSEPLNSFVGCHAYNGGDLTPSVEAYAFYIDNTDNTMITGCYVDNGNLYIKDSFNHNICGTHFQRTGAGSNDSGIFIDTSAVADQVQGLCVTGCTFNGTFSQGAIEFGGSGTYASDTFKLIQWVGNTLSDGQPAWYNAKFGNAAYMEYGTTTVNPSGAYHVTQSTKGIRLSADYDNNSANTDSYITFATDGVDKWNIIDSGWLVPNSDVAYSIGSSTKRVFNTFSNRFTLVDGISEPATIAGHAQLFVDSADNKLKVKFGDGDVVEIATNPV